MQPAPVRLQRAIWSAFRASKPITSCIARGCFQQAAPSRPVQRPVFQPVVQRWQPSPLSQVRFYSDDKQSDVAEKLADAARQRTGETIESKADSIINLPGPVQDNVKSKEDETIVHTYPESSSIVYNPDSPGESAAQDAASTLHARADEADTRASSEGQDAFSRSQPSPGSSDSPPDDPLPSQLAARYSRVRERFTDFMDNFQTHVFTASKRLNDLTGYSSIEQLKKEIEEQEHKTRRARQHVKDCRTAYQAAIATRSDTQREVNDLLHRKHAWSAQDLERFTNLYRSDHANEQAEQQAHSELAQAEAAYEEASTKLSKSILARYHEEQVWSDKIRQMSTWGTWGLMGLNVLLFIVFQILVEPWRRRRLVRGFEEKVQEALKEQSAEQELRTIFHISKAQEGALSVAAAAGAETNVSAAGQEDDRQQEPAQITQSETTDPPIEEMAQRTVIEQAAESATMAEVAAEHTAQPAVANSTPEVTTQSTAAPEVETSAVENPSQAPVDADADAQPAQSAPSGPLPNLSDAEFKDIPFLLGQYTRQYLSIGNAKLWSLFDEQREVTISQRDLTAKVLEGAFVGAVGVVCFFWAVGISSVRPR